MGLGLTVLALPRAYDDPYITYRYADNLANGIGFVYNPGQRVLSTTTPLFALGLAVFSWLGLDVPLVAKLLGGLSMAFSGFLFWDLARSWKTPGVGWAGLGLYPTFALVFTSIGSETPLYLALCLAAVAAYARKRYSLAAVSSALAVLARPDGVLVPVILFLDLIASIILEARLSIPKGNRFKWVSARLVRVLMTPAVWFTLILGGWAVFAWSYFGSPLPVTLAAKQGQGLMAISQRFAPGFMRAIAWYLSPSQWPYWGAAALALLGVYMLTKRRGWWIVVAWTMTYFAAYTILGVTSYCWYYAPLVPGFVVLVGLGLEAVRQYSAWSALRPAWRQAGILLIMVVLLIAQGRGLWALHRSPDPRLHIYRAVGEWLSDNTLPTEQVGAVEIGILGYYARRPMVDFAGLLQPAVAAQMGAGTNYEDTALWAVQQYRPDYLVVHQGLFMRLEQAAVADGCRVTQVFPAIDYHFNQDILIYHCPTKEVPYEFYPDHHPGGDPDRAKGIWRRTRFFYGNLPGAPLR